MASSQWCKSVATDAISAREAIDWHSQSRPFSATLYTVVWGLQNSGLNN